MVMMILGILLAILFYVKINIFFFAKYKVNNEDENFDVK
jgi:hypothetical protein